MVSAGSDKLYFWEMIRHVSVGWFVRSLTFLGRISRKRLDIEAQFRRTTYRMAYGKSNGRHVTDDVSRQVTLKGQGRDPIMFGAHYLDNGWTYRFGYNGAPIGNGTMANRMDTWLKVKMADWRPGGGLCAVPACLYSRWSLVNKRTNQPTNEPSQQTNTAKVIKN